MLSPEYLDACSDPLLKLYEDLEDQIIADIARRIAKTGTLTDTADWQFKVIREIGAVQQDIITRVSQMSGRTEDEIRRLFQESAYINIETNAAPLISNGYAVELDLTPPMRQLIEATFRRTAGDINNLTLTTGATGGNLYYEMCNQAYMQASSGAFSPQEAIWNAVKGAAQEGATVQYAKRRDKLDVAIRRNILTSLNQTAGKITEMNADQLGAEYYETSAHPGARPSHAAWQGRVFKIVGATREYPNFVESTGYGTAGGLCGINCRHSFYPFFPGLSERAYSSDKLAWYRTHTVQYNGEDYTDYEASQIQRAMERSIRESKRRAIAAKAAEDGATDEETKRHLKEKFSEESSILKQKEQRLKDFLKQTGRDAETSRVRVNGFDRSISQKAVWANRRLTSSNPFASEREVDNSISFKTEAYRSKHSPNSGQLRSARKMEEVCRNIRSEMSEYANRESKWNGKVDIVSRLEDKASGIKRWDCHISALPTTKDDTLWHEMLHSSSSSYYGKDGYVKYGKIEEASVELLTREICREKGISYSKSYEQYVEILDYLCKYLNYDRMTFAKELYNQDLPKRLDWLENKVRAKLNQDNALFKDKNAVIAFVRKLDGGRDV